MYFSPFEPKSASCDGSVHSFPLHGSGTDPPTSSCPLHFSKLPVPLLRVTKVFSHFVSGMNATKIIILVVMVTICFLK